MDGAHDAEVAAAVTDTCWACQLARGDPRQHKSQWFWLSEDGAVVEDLNPKGYAMRLLYVPPVHVACGQEPPEFRRVAEDLLAAVANVLYLERGLVAVGLDLNIHSYKAHWHAQCNLVGTGMMGNEQLVTGGWQVKGLHRLHLIVINAWPIRQIRDLCVIIRYHLTGDCGMACDWVKPYGFVPEADCPIHDRTV